MEISKEFLENEIASISQQKQQFLDNANMCEGAIQSARQMAAYLAKELEESPEE